MAEEMTSATRRRTKKIIRDSFLGLLERKPFERITVRDLCEEADINRTTFYRYYTDMFALNDELADDLFETLFTELAERSRRSTPPNYHSVKAQMLEALTIIEENRRLCQILFCTSGNGEFSNRLSSAFIDAIFPQDQCSLKPEVVLIQTYTASGILAIVRAWLASGCAVKRDIVADIMNRTFMDAYKIMKEFQYSEETIKN